jgi:hypothetical protein
VSSVNDSDCVLPFHTPFHTPFQALKTTNGSMVKEGA